MRLKGRQSRFLAAILTLWCGARIAALWPAAGPPATTPTPVQVAEAPPPFAPSSHQAFTASTAAPFVPWQTLSPTPPGPARLAALTPGDHADAMLMLTQLGGDGRLQAQVMLRRVTYAYTEAGSGDDRPPSPADAAPAPSIDLDPEHWRHPWTGEAYLFVRPGSGRAALSPGGQLGGSQAAVRVAWSPDPDAKVPVAAVARIYAPLRSKGAEAAIGIDVHPLGRAPLRLSVERRQRLDRAGRSAFSAYAAGGLYRETHGMIVDGYAQAGVVGLKRGDLFVDGALRVGKRVGNVAGPVLGAGLWGAAQPGVARLDAGPRAAWRLPVEHAALTLAAEGRFRIAGSARPGSGAALTLAASL